MAYSTIDKPTDYFNTVLYTGDGNNSRAVTGTGFQADWVWLKDRGSKGDTNYHHQTFDSVRGASAGALYTSLTNAEDSNYPISSFDSDGITLRSTSHDSQNASSETYVLWSWLAGGTASSNTDGSITSSVSANTTAGFSIVTYTGTGSNATVGHGLGVAPSFIIVRQRDSSNDWNVFHHKNTSAPETDFLALNEADATLDASNRWNDTMPNATNVFLGDSNRVNNNSNSYVMYAFAEKKGYSKFGTYVGNANTDGPFVYTGFKPAWIMVKATDATKSWYMWDNKRAGGSNLNDDQLLANTEDAEFDGSNIDMLSNGFKFRSSGSGEQGSGTNYVYMAFAESPFVSSKGIPTIAR